MGFTSRSASMIRYRVRGEISGNFWDAVDEGVRKGAFRSLGTGGDEIGMGWTSMEDFTDNEFNGASYVRGNFVALGLRIDTARVPPRILEMHLKQEGKKFLQESGARRLSKAQRRELKDRVKEMLKQQVLPSIQVFDLVWDTAQGIACFASLSIKARERVEDHFKRSFGLSLIPLIPYIRAEELLTENSDRRALEMLNPCSMLP